MWRLHVLFSRARSVVGKREADTELSREIDEHIRLLAERYVRQGMSPEEAGCAARRQFGGVAQRQEYHRETRTIAWINDLRRDLAFGMRLLRKRPGFSFVAIAILALAIGANTAVFSVAKGVVFASLPFPKPDRLALIFESDVGGRFEPGKRNLVSVRPGVFQDWRDQSRSFQTIAAVHDMRGTILKGDRATVGFGYRAGEGFFEALGVPAHLGRHFTASDYKASGGEVVVLADRFWRELPIRRIHYRARHLDRRRLLSHHRRHASRFYSGGPRTQSAILDTSALGCGHQVQLCVLGLHGLCTTEGWRDARPSSGGNGQCPAGMRLAHPAFFNGGTSVAPLDAYMFGDHERLFALLLTAVGLVLLIACANLANLLLARALERRREFTVRSAMGASRIAILRQVLTESLVIALGGLQHAIHKIDPEIGIVEVDTLSSAMSESLWRERFAALLVGLFAALAAIIATGGLYAVVSYAVQRRTQEMCVRLALGASGGQIAQTVLGHGLRVTGAGILAGALLTLAAARFVTWTSDQLHDLPVMVAGVAALLVVMLAACGVPLRRALAVDPAAALRSE